MQLLRTVLFCLCLSCLACRQRSVTESPLPLAPEASLTPAPPGQCSSADFVVFASEQEKGLRFHGVKLLKGRQSGNEIHLDINVVGEEEEAKVALVAVEYFYTQYTSGGKVEQYRGRFVRHENTFFAVLISGPHVTAETLVSDESAKEYLSRLFADGEKVCAQIEAKMQSDEPTEAQKLEMLSLFQDMVVRHFCQRQTLPAWGNEGRTYFPLWKKPVEKVIPPTPQEHPTPAGGQIA